MKHYAPMIQRVASVIWICILWTGGISSSYAASSDSSKALEGKALETFFIVYPLVLAEECTQVDELLRWACARIGSNPPKSMEKNCELPKQKFSERIAQQLRSYREANRVEIQQNEREITDAMTKMQNSLDREFVKVKAMKFISTDFYSMSETLDRDCKERIDILLAPRRKSD